MRISIPCQQCEEEGFILDANKTVPYIPSYPYWEYPLIQLDKWPFYEITCPKGHKHRYIISNELYDVLFQQATYCLKDAYYREAILTYHTALERFFEYCIEILCYSNENFEYFEILWKEVKKQSERQLGAYYFVWYTVTGTPPTILDRKKVEIRNNVVHSGFLSNENEAKEYGLYIFEYIRTTNEKLTELLGEKLSLSQANRTFRICKKDIEKAAEHPIVISTDEDAKYEGIGSIYIPSYLSSKENYPDYNSCLCEDVNNTIGFIK